MKPITKENLEKKMKEIDGLQSQFDNIYGNRNIVIKWLHRKEAKRIHLLASKKLLELSDGNLD